MGSELRGFAKQILALLLARSFNKRYAVRLRLPKGRAFASPSQTRVPLDEIVTFDKLYKKER